MWSFMSTLLLGSLGLVAAINYTEWSEWSACSQTCYNPHEGDVHRERVRSCIGENGNCEGCRRSNLVLEFKCNLPKCPVHGGWGGWSPWSACSERCYGGVMKRERECNHPKAKRGGKYCENGHQELKHCNTKPCPVDSVVGQWSSWSNCSSNCQEGETTTRRRTCIPPRYSGRPCPNMVQRKPCPTEAPYCTVDGGWSDWGEWGACNLPVCSYRNTTQVRRRQCNKPEPKNGGQPCQADEQDRKDKDKRTCSVLEPHCPVNGGWGEWGPWSPVMGDPDKETSVRRCDNPPMRNNGRPCPADGFTRERDTADSSGSGSGSGSGDDLEA